VDFDEYLLCNIFGIVVIVHEPIGEVVHLPHMQLHQIPKRIIVSLLGLEYQVPLPVSGHSGRSLLEVFDD
jgi:hypothetical protein